jgi:hypothetical protein
MLAHRLEPIPHFPVVKEPTDRGPVKMVATLAGSLIEMKEDEADLVEEAGRWSVDIDHAYGRFLGDDDWLAALAHK